MKGTDDAVGGDRPAGFEPLARRSVTADAIGLIKEMILDGRLQPGQRLPSERALSEALGVSRPTVRESIQSLVAMNILEARHGAGTFVSSLDIKDLLRPVRFALGLTEARLDDLFEVRLLLEPAAAELAAARANGETVRALERCVERAREHHEEPDEFLSQDVELHRLVVEGSGNPLLVNLLASISALSVESRALTVRLPGVVERTIRDHTAIVRAIAAGDQSAARDAMHAHVGNVQRAVRESGSLRPRRRTRRA